MRATHIRRHAQKRWFDSYHSTVIGPIHKKPQAKTQMSFGRNLPERIS